MAATVKQERKVRIRHKQNMWSRMSGAMGTSSFHWREGRKEVNQVTGVHLGSLLGVDLLHGAEVEVTVRLVKQGKAKRNPWLDRK